jgi:plasmid stabilization system protein ParE
MVAAGVTIAPEAIEEVVRIAAWWSKHRPQAPRLFLVELDAALALLARQPESGPRVKARGRSRLRCITLRRSGYVVFYELFVETRRVVVVRARHGRRRPLRR